MDEAGFELTHLYGLTETYGPATLNEWHAAWDELPAEERLAKRIRQGVRYHALEDLTVMDPATMEKTPADGETIGEVMFRGNIVMKGYLKNAKATDEAFAGGWFHSGDLGVMHPDGYIQLKDRSKDIIISGGENISSIEVEDVLYKHPAVLSAAVVAKPDPKWGETPCAFVELRTGATLSEADDHRLVQREARPLQMSAPRGVRRPAQDLDRQDPKIQAARIGEGRLGPSTLSCRHGRGRVHDRGHAVLAAVMRMFVAMPVRCPCLPWPWLMVSMIMATMVVVPAAIMMVVVG